MPYQYYCQKLDDFSSSISSSLSYCWHKALYSQQLKSVQIPHIKIYDMSFKGSKNLNIQLDMWASLKNVVRALFLSL